jgi:hypothetical protein
VGIGDGSGEGFKHTLSTANMTYRDNVTRQPSVGRESVRIFSPLREEL